MCEGTSAVIPRMLYRFTLLFPFLAYEAILTATLSDTPSEILNVGCGLKSLSSMFGTKSQIAEKYYSVGTDIWAPYLAQAMGHDDLVRCDIRNLPFKSKSFRVVVAKDVLEHLTRREALEFLEEIEGIATGVVIVIVPNGPNEKHELEDRNPWQSHRSYWVPSDLRIRGYKIRGADGLRPLYGERGQLRWKSIPWRQLLFVLRFMSLPFGYLMAGGSLHLVCLKETQNGH